MMTKADVLQALLDGEFVSGQELCRRFDVSRTAVWKRIRQLSDDGYEIEAVPNRGYRLCASPDRIDAGLIRNYLTTRWMGRTIFAFDTIDSTNQYAKALAEEGCEDGTLVVADRQTSGKGRRGRTWETPPGVSIAMTVVLRPQIAPERISMITLLMGMAAAKECREAYALPALIKWPNDVVVHGKKICGILTEMTTDLLQVAFIVVGTGINVNMEEIPSFLENTATSIQLETGRKVCRARLIAGVLKQFEELYERFLEKGDLSDLMEEYNELLVNRGREVTVLETAGQFRGIALGIDDRGQLMVQGEDETIRKVYAGEVSVRGVYGYV